MADCRQGGDIRFVTSMRHDGVISSGKKEEEAGKRRRQGGR